MNAQHRTPWLARAGAMILAAAVAACAAPPPPVIPTIEHSSGPVPIDGTYQGSRQLVRGGDGPGALCGTMDPISITVAGNAFQYVLNQPEVPYQPTRSFAETIDASGVFNAADGPAFMRGQVGGGHMQGQISGDACGYLFQADRTGP